MLLALVVGMKPTETRNDRVRLEQLRDKEENDEQLTKAEIAEFVAILERNSHLNRRAVNQ